MIFQKFAGKAFSEIADLKAILLKKQTSVIFVFFKRKFKIPSKDILNLENLNDKNINYSKYF